MKKIIVIGGGDFAKKVIRLLQKIKKYNIIGYTDHQDRGLVFNIKYLGSDGALSKLNKEIKNVNAVLAIGGNTKDLLMRKELITKIKKIGIKTPSIISPSATIEKYSSIKDGCVVFDGSLIDYSVSVGNFSVINLNATICHDCKISENLILSPGSIILGNCKVGKNVFIGANATINQYIKVNDECIIGSGAVVTKNCLSKGIYVGNPARRTN